MPRKTVEYDEMINDTASESGYSSQLIRAFLLSENPQLINDAVSPNNDGTTDHGLWQINSQHEEFLKKKGIITDLKDLNDPSTNIRAHIAILDDLKRQGARTPEQFAAGYNTGKINNVNSPYVEKFMGNYKSLTEMDETQPPEQLGGPPLETPLQPGERRSESTKTVTKTHNPELGENTGLIMDALKSARTELSSAQDLYKAGSEKVRGFGTEMADAISQMATAASQLVLGDSSLKMDKEARNKKISGAFGIDIDASNEVLSTLASKMIQEGMAHQTALQDYNSLREVSFFDNPISWLSAQLNIPQAGAKVNTHARNLDAASDTFRTLTESATAAIQNNNLAAATTDANQARLLAKTKLLEGVEAAKKVGLLTEKEALEFVGKAATAKVTDLHLLMGVEKLSIEEATKQYMQSIRGMQNDAKEEERKQLDESLRRASAVLGTPLTRGSVSKLGVTERNAIIKIGLTGRIGENILDAISNKEYLASNPNNAGAEKILKKANDLINTARAAVPPTITKAAEVNAAVARGITNQFQSWNLNAADGGAENPYAGPSPTAILQSNPDLQAKIPLLIPVLKAMGSTNQPIHPQVMVDAIVKSFVYDKDGNPQIPKAQNIMEISRELDTYYSAIVDNNNQTYKYGALALPTQTTYNARIKGVKGSVEGGAVNFNNPVEVSNMLYSKVAQLFMPVLEQEFREKREIPAKQRSYQGMAKNPRVVNE